MISGEDFILDPCVLSALEEYLEAGGDTVDVIEALADGYCGKAQVSRVSRETYTTTTPWCDGNVDVSQICNTLTNWMRDLGQKEEAVECLESSVQTQILRHFDDGKDGMEREYKTVLYLRFKLWDMKNNNTQDIAVALQRRRTLSSRKMQRVQIG